METDKITLTLLGREIRTLYESEIDCRIGQKFDKTQSVSLLLYKDARVDMALLDELVGPESWQRDHKEVGGNNYCGVGINAGGQWIWKWDCGTPSQTEPQKGEASDSFKRACVNWGIGRELYTAPRIVVRLTDSEWNGGRPFVRFSVARITYTGAREIDELIIEDSNGNIRFDNRGKRPVSAPSTPETSKESPRSVNAAEKGQKRIVTVASVRKGLAGRLVQQLADARAATGGEWSDCAEALRTANPDLVFAAGALDAIRGLAENLVNQK